MIKDYNRAVKKFSTNSSISFVLASKGVMLQANTIKAFKAGCDLVLHCNGNYQEMVTVAKNSPKVNVFITKKTSQFYRILS